MAKGPQAQTIVVIDRATDVLQLFAGSGEPTLGVTEIAHALKLSKAVVYRILSSFRAKGFVEVDETDRADARRGEIHRSRRPQPARTDHEDA